MTSVLIIGYGGREHAIARALDESPDVSDLWVSSQNVGLMDLKKAKPYDLDLNKMKPGYEDVLDLSFKQNINMVVIGPEKHLLDGMVDTLEESGFKVFGPRKDAARLETNKSWAKDFMLDNEIPTAEYVSFTSSNRSHYRKASKFIKGFGPTREEPWDGFVIKASGLYGGKGVVVCDTQEDACKAVQLFADQPNRELKKASETIIVERKLKGYELSVQAFIDGNGDFILLPPSQDHKNRYEGGLGANTGGMGTICPYPIFDEEIMKISQDIIRKTINGLKELNMKYRGILYVGLMISDDNEVNVLEFNCRFGDPEAQAILPLMKSDLFSLFKGCCEDKLSSCSLEFEKKFASAVSVVIDSYPLVHQRSLGNVITGIEQAKQHPGVRIYFAGTSRTDKGLYKTSAGRVLTVCAKADSLSEAIATANKGARHIQFETEQRASSVAFRSDIGTATNAKYFYQTYKKRYAEGTAKGLSYADAGVSIEKGKSFVEIIKDVVSVVGVRSDNIGGFGAIYNLNKKKYNDPILVSGTDGVGTKIQMAQQMKRHYSIGTDLVAMCVNDILTCGAEPLFFLDYFACGQLDLDIGSEIVRGISYACNLAKCPLIGGETAEMPGMYKPGVYDLAGFAVGAVESENLLPKKGAMEVGNLLIGFSSSGLHSNGFSLVRKVVEQLALDLSEPAPFNPEKKLGDILLTPTCMYTDLRPIIRNESMINGMAHITGGGLVDNICRILPDNLSAVIDNSWVPHDVFLWLMSTGIGWDEMVKTFNMGIGLVLVVSDGDDGDGESDDGVRSSYWENVLRSREIQKFNPYIIGTLEKADEEKGNTIRFSGIMEEFVKLAGELQSKYPNIVSPIMGKKKKVAVLISGTGSNLQALIKHTTGISCAEITIVISNVSTAKGLRVAKDAGIPTKVICHDDFKSREAFEQSIQSALAAASVEYICLAGFMRILSKNFIDHWQGKILNVHPSLLPAFKGCDAPDQALKAGVVVTGCTVHFVSEEVDGGKILDQAPVTVLPGDTAESLTERIKHVEHKIYPRVLEEVVQGKLKFLGEKKIKH